MAKQNTTALDLANVVLQGTISATGVSPAVPLYGYFNFFLGGAPGTNNLVGTFTATAQLEKSFDGGASWYPVSLDTSGDPAIYTTSVTVTGFEHEPGMLYRVDCTAYTSGTPFYRLSQNTPSTIPIFKVG